MQKNGTTRTGSFRWEWALLLSAIIVGALLRLWRLDAFPPGLYRDEAFNGLDALGVLNGRHALFFPANNGREPAYIYLTAVSIALFGRSVFALRLAAAVAGALITWITYQVGRSWFDRRVGLLAAWLWAVTLWPLHLSRLGLRVVLLAATLGLTAWLAALALRGDPRRRRQLWLWVAAGAAYGAAFYTYLAARFTPLLLLALLLWFGWREKGRLRLRLWPGALYFGAGALLTLLPWLWLFAQQPELLLGRSGQVSIFNPTIHGGDPWGALLAQIGRGLGLFIWRGDTILRHNPAGRPLFDWVMAIPFLVGLLLCLRGWRQPAAAALLLWVGVMLGPTILAEDAPHFLRAAGILPAALLLPAVGLAALWQWPRLPRLLRRSAVVAVVSVSLAFTIRDYVNYSRDPQTALLFEAAATQLAAQIAQEHGETAVYLDRWFWDESTQKGWPSIPYLADLSEVRFYRPEFGAPPVGPGPPAAPYQQAAVYAWPFGDLTFVQPLLPLQGEAEVTVGPLARGDLEPQSYPLYVRYHLRPGGAAPETAAAFGDELLLREAKAAVDGRLLTVTLAWEAPAGVSRPWVAFVHVLGPDGLLAQDDAPPGRGYWLPQWYRPGLTLRETRTLALPQPFDPALYRIEVGVYDPETAVRLPVVDAQGNPVGDSWPLQQSND